ncbi:phage tail protein [Geminisphaera colitermitum]|uniref:phage tail protein n=1 Tax=Geminisphaera colitermitum TaxID=1148786 RepID=UPI0001964E44|nr:phage tail protein [Geminisphaera colitermitum]
MTITVGNIVAFAVMVGSMVYSRIQQRKMEKAARKLEGATLTTREPAAARRVIYGTQRVGGIIIYMSGSGKKNTYLNMVVAVAGHEVNAIKGLWLDDTRVPLDANGNAVAPTSGGAPNQALHWMDTKEMERRGIAPTSIYDDGGAKVPSYVGVVHAEFFTGSPNQTACATLMNELPGKWTANHRLRGVAYVYVRIKYNTDKFRAQPNVSVLVEGKKVYDPRTSTTAFSSNAALCIRDYMSDSAYGLGCSSAELDDAATIRAANICDEVVALKNGRTERRYTCNGVIYTSDAPGDVLESMLKSMAGAAIYSGGLWRLRAGAHQEPSATFGFSDLRGEVNFQPGDSLRETCNAVKGTYISPEGKWQPSDFPPIKNATYYAQDNNERIWRDVEYAFTTAPATAQRLAKIELERSRQDITVRLPLKLQGMRVRAGDVVALDMPRYGWNGKLFEVMSWKFVVSDADLTALGGGKNGEGSSGPTLGIDLELRETAASVWDWNNGEETTVDPAPNGDPPAGDPDTPPVITINPLPVTATAGVSFPVTGSVVAADGDLAGVSVAWVTLGAGDAPEGEQTLSVAVCSGATKNNYAINTTAVPMSEGRYRVEVRAVVDGGGETVMQSGVVVVTAEEVPDPDPILQEVFSFDPANNDIFYTGNRVAAGSGGGRYIVRGGWVWIDVRVQVSSVNSSYLNGTVSLNLSSLIPAQYHPSTADYGDLNRVHMTAYLRAADIDDLGHTPMHIRFGASAGQGIGTLLGLIEYVTTNSQIGQWPASRIRGNTTLEFNLSYPLVA